MGWLIICEAADTGTSPNLANWQLNWDLGICLCEHMGLAKYRNLTLKFSMFMIETRKLQLQFNL